MSTLRHLLTICLVFMAIEVSIGSARADDEEWKVEAIGASLCKALRAISSDPILKSYSIQGNNLNMEMLWQSIGSKKWTSKFTITFGSGGKIDGIKYSDDCTFPSYDLMCVEKWRQAQNAAFDARTQKEDSKPTAEAKKNGAESLLDKLAKRVDNIEGSIETRLTQSWPVPMKDGEMTRTKDCKRAVVLIHGLRLHIGNTDGVSQANTRDWQESGSPMVNALRKKGADVFAFAYSQNVAFVKIVDDKGIHGSIEKLKKMGYSEIVLVGHSAGGLIARYFVEDNPDAGVMKVVQVCTPNAGSALTKLPFGIPQSQRPFVDSFSPQSRENDLRRRPNKKIPKKVEFACVVATVKGFNGDGVVSLESQWPTDLQTQGIPVAFVTADHLKVVSIHEATVRIAEVAIEPQNRWSKAEIKEARDRILTGFPENR